MTGYMEHPCEEVRQKIRELSDALCSWERATSRESVLIVREVEGFVYRAMSGKPGIPDDEPDERLLNLVAPERPDFTEEKIAQQAGVLLSLMRELVKTGDGPHMYWEAKKHALFLTRADAERLEAEFPKLIIDEVKDSKVCIGDVKAEFKVTFASLLATVTWMLCGERLAFVTEQGSSLARDFCWYRDPGEPEAPRRD